MPIERDMESQAGSTPLTESSTLYQKGEGNYTVNLNLPCYFMEASLPYLCRAHRVSAAWTDDCPTTSRMPFDLDSKRRRGLLGYGETSIDANKTIWESNVEQVY